MMPVVFRIPWIERDVPGYGLMMMIGFLLSIIWAARRAARSRANPDVILNCGFVSLIAGVVGARLMYVVHYWGQFSGRGGPLDVAWAIIDVSKGGLEFYGGLILAVVCVSLWLLLKERVSWRWYMDICAPSAALGLAFGRVGCLLNGCCFGGPTELPWAVRFPYGSQAAFQHWQDRNPQAALPEELIFVGPSGVGLPVLRESLDHIDQSLAAEEKVRHQVDGLKASLAAASDPAEKTRFEAQVKTAERKLADAQVVCVDARTQLRRYGLSAQQLRDLASGYGSAYIHPAQIYSTITALIIALLLNAIYWRRTRDGQVIFSLFLIEPAARLVLESIRADNPVDTLGQFTISQFLAIAMTLAGLVGLLILQRMPPRSIRATPWEEPTEEKPPAKAAPKPATV